MITISKIPIGKYYCDHLLDLNAVSKDCFKDYKYVIIYDKLESSYKIHLCECIDLFVNNKKDYIDNNLYELLLKISLVNSYITSLEVLLELNRDNFVKIIKSLPRIFIQMILVNNVLVIMFFVNNSINLIDSNILLTTSFMHNDINLIKTLIKNDINKIIVFFEFDENKHLLTKINTQIIQLLYESKIINTKIINSHVDIKRIIFFDGKLFDKLLKLNMNNIKIIIEEAINNDCEKVIEHCHKNDLLDDIIVILIHAINGRKCNIICKLAQYININMMTESIIEKLKHCVKNIDATSGNIISLTYYSFGLISLNQLDDNDNYNEYYYDNDYDDDYDYEYDDDLSMNFENITNPMTLMHIEDMRVTNNYLTFYCCICQDDIYDKKYRYQLNCCNKNICTCCVNNAINKINSSCPFCRQSFSLQQ